MFLELVDLFSHSDLVVDPVFDHKPNEVVDVGSDHSLVFVDYFPFLKGYHELLPTHGNDGVLLEHKVSAHYICVTDLVLFT